jgi:group I intron endonuclease
VGSANDLSKRFRIYYSLLTIEKILNKSKSHILNALLKYGYSKFTLEILEYCDLADLIKREQYYIDLLKPEYNILQIAGSRLGSIHTKETLAKMSESLKGEKKSYVW